MHHPQALFAEYKGAKSREAPANLSPVGTGLYKFATSSRATDPRRTLSRLSHCEPPYFDSIEMKGGGDAVSAARAVSRPASMTLAGTSRSRTTSCCAWKRAAAARPSTGPAAISSSLSSTRPIPDGGRRRAVLDQDRSIRRSPTRRCAGALPARRSRCNQEVHLWPGRPHDGQFRGPGRQRPREVRERSGRSSTHLI